MITVNRRRLHTGESVVNYSRMYLTFEALESGTFQFTNAVNYSLDGGATWIALAAATATPTLSEGERIMWKATITPTSSAGVGTFSSTGNYNAMGNPLSLRSGDSFKGITTMPENTYMFNHLFYQSTKLINAENLKLVCTTLRSYCYIQMFRGCTYLQTAPELPATTLVGNCYREMFWDCKALTTAPVLPAATLTTNCYYQMFYGCSSLRNVKSLATNISASNCLFRWLTNVSSTGTFIKDANMTSWPRSANGIPSGWTVQDAT